MHTKAAYFQADDISNRFDRIMKLRQEKAKYLKFISRKNHER